MSEITKCPLCGGDSYVLDEFVYFDKGEYARLRQCIKCKAIYKNIYHLVYDSQKIWDAKSESFTGGEKE
jgi:hypothetical protein